MKYTNEENYTLSIAAWLGADSYDHQPVSGPYISATGLLKPIKIQVLSQRNQVQRAKNKEEEIKDLSSLVPSRLGTAVHSDIEKVWKTRYRESLLSLNYSKKIVERIKVNPKPEELTKDTIPVYMEQRAFKKVDGVTIGGMYDFIGNGVLEDFKTMGVYGYMKGDKDEEQRMQGSIYRWLNPKIITADYMLIQQIFTDWSKLGAMTQKNYPQNRIIAKKLKLLSIEEVDMWIRKKLKEIKQYAKTPEKKLPRCTQKDLWQDNPKYKYYKNPANTKRSTKNFDDYTEAHNRFLKDNQVGVITEVVGKVKRCNYCPGYELCTQKDEYIEQGILTPV